MARSVRRGFVLTRTLNTPTLPSARITIATVAVAVSPTRTTPRTSGAVLPRRSRGWAIDEPLLGMAASHSDSVTSGTNTCGGTTSRSGVPRAAQPTLAAVTTKPATMARTTRWLHASCLFIRVTSLSNVSAEHLDKLHTRGTSSPARALAASSSCYAARRWCSWLFVCPLHHRLDTPHAVCASNIHSLPVLGWTEHRPSGEQWEDVYTST